eukprot:jgi/Chlat1/4667/Chrsp3S05614
MSMEITQVLLNAQNPDGAVRKAAEDSLKQFQEQNHALFLLALAHELAADSKPAESRRLAGLILKNALDAKEEARKAELVAQWVQLDAGLRSQIKAALLATLSSTVSEARHTAAQVIAKIAGVELQRKEWGDLISTLLQNMSVQGKDHLKQATLETLGFVCEEIEPEMLEQDQVNNILTAVVQGMRKEEPNNDVRLAATSALYNALDFAHTNFENEFERNYIMQVACEATLSPDVRVRQIAFECLVTVCSTYYDKMVPYIKDIFSLTSKAAKEDAEPVALQAIELWSTISEEEIALDEEYDEEDTEVINHHFVKQALPALVPMLLETLTKQEEGQDTEENVWNVSMAGGTCLGLVANNVKDDIVPLVMPYVRENIAKPDWRCREAATFSFGSILEGPSLEQLTPLVNMGLEYLLNAMKDESSHVKDTTAWTLGRIFEFLHGPNVKYPVITPQNLTPIISVLLDSIRDVPNVAEKVSWAIHNLATGFEVSISDEDDASSLSSPMSPFFSNIVTALLATADREDAQETRLRAAAYETLNEVVRCSAPDTVPTVAQLIPVIMQKLDETLQMQTLSADDRERQSELQGLLCGVLQVVIQKLGARDSTKPAILQYADKMMELFLRVFACRSATVHEEAMLAIGALAYATGSQFGKYMQSFYAYLDVGLRNFEEYQVCSITVGVVGDICRALEDKVLPFCDGIVYQLLHNLQSNELHRSVKPPILSCFGDIALAIGGEFEKYLPYVGPMLQSAAQLSAQQSKQDEELIDYNNSLRNGIFEAYSGIFQGFKGQKADRMLPFADHILSFVESVAQDQDRDDAVTRSAVGVLGDMADALGPSVAPVFANRPFYREFLTECIQSEDDAIKNTAAWAQSIVSSLVGS